jgi:hypothetical protein
LQLIEPSLYAIFAPSLHSESIVHTKQQHASTIFSTEIGYLSPTMDKSPLHILVQLVEPPSYADAIFAPPYMGSSSDTEIQSAANGASESQASTSRPQQLVLNISVTEPQKIVEGSGSSLVPGSGSFVSYKVSCVTSFQ